MKKKRKDNLVKFDACNNIYEIVERLRHLKEGHPYYLDARTVNIVKNGYEQAVRVTRAKLYYIGQPEIITEEEYEEADSHFYNIIFNAVHRVNKADAYTNDTQFILSFFVYIADLLEEFDMKFEVIS